MSVRTWPVLSRGIGVGNFWLGNFWREAGCDGKTISQAVSHIKSANQLILHALANGSSFVGALAASSLRDSDWPDYRELGPGREWSGPFLPAAT